MARAANWRATVTCPNCRARVAEPQQHETLGPVCPLCLHVLAITRKSEPQEPRRRRTSGKTKNPRRGSSTSVNPALRLRVYKRDGFVCVKCGYHGADLTLDHVVPRSKGGRNSYENLQTMCRPCNEEKADTMPDRKER